MNISSIKKAAEFLLIAISILITFNTLISFEKSISNETKWPDKDLIFQSKILEINNTKTFFKRYLLSFFHTINAHRPVEIKEILDANGIVYYEVNNLNFNELDNDLPSSGRNYAPMKIYLENKWENAEIKYRGDFFYHWGFDKKSYSIKLKNNEKINLVNPKNVDFIGDLISLKIAKDDLSLYAPKASFEGLFINGRFAGIFMSVEDINDTFSKNNEFDFILDGEKISFSDTTGEKLFIDYKKWKNSGGILNENNEKIVKEFMGSLIMEDHKRFFNFIDVNYWANFYTFVAITNNFHYDNNHNWKLGYKQNRFFPIVWDPYAWSFPMIENNEDFSYEEMITPISSLLRKNIYFNQLFSENIWKYLNNKSFMNKNYIDKEKNRLFPVLNYDLFKGSASNNNKNGVRYPQSSNEILENIDSLEGKINGLNENIKSELSKAKASYWISNNYLYINYIGRAGSLLMEINDGSFESISHEVFIYNYNEFVRMPKIADNDKLLLVSGRDKIKNNNYSFSLSSICPTTYRIYIGQLNEPKILIRHSLTNEVINPKLIEGGVINDCKMSLDDPHEKILSESDLIMNKNTSLFIYTHDEKVASISDFDEGDDFKIDLNIESKHCSGKIKKKPFSDIARINIKDDLIFKNNKFNLIEKKEKSNGYYSSQKKAKELGFPVPRTELINLIANDFDLGQYYLFEQPNKAFLEKNKFTSDTDVYLKKDFDSLVEDGWKKIASDPRNDEKDISSLIDFLDKTKSSNDIEDYIDIDNFNNLVKFMVDTGNENIDYLLIFDNTQNKYIFIPYYYTSYKTGLSYQIKDPLILKIKNTLDSKYYQKKLSRNDSLNEFDELLNDHKIVLKENNTYEVNSNIIIPPDVETIIEKGVTIKLAEGKSIVSYGKVSALGTSDSRIKVSSSGKKPFGVFALVGTKASDSHLSNVIFNNGSETFIDHTYLSGMFSVYHADDAVVRNSTFKNAQADDALNFKYSNSSVYDSLFENNSADAIDFDFMSGEISGNTFIKNGNDSIDTSGSTTLVKNNYIKDSGDKCISVGEKSYLMITNNILDGCLIGIETKDESSPVISQTVFKNNKTALNAYQKKDFFGPAYPTITTSLFINNDKNVTTENTFDGKKLDSDDSEITVTDSIFDHLSDKKLLEKNQELKSLSDETQYFIDKMMGLVYPEQVPSP